ncbi:C39 family peptidase [Burkholderia sp. BCC1999]|uniref:C39 family peptidase n=1 Tax=Burkholderia sp. BCC1999 TaxID=2817448 RepID=UPI002AC361CC|nr:C39 family peptidase [Burkholderia sp. BCC1999]
MTDVPYFSQWESRMLIDKFLSGELRSEDDPLWHESGAGSPEEYAQWSPHICGIACLKMMLAHRTRRVVPLLDLVRDAVTFGVYRPELGDDGKRLLYRPFVQWLGERFGIRGSVVEHTESARLDDRLRDGHMLMASVHPGIRHRDFEPPGRGGHLVLVLGVDAQSGDWIFHNPSGFELHTQENVTMRRDTFDRYFANRGILIAPQD